MRFLRSAINIAVAVLSLASFGSLAHAQSPPPRVIHVFVALADNQHQGIVPVPARLGNGLDPARNLYWGAAAGVKTFFDRSPNWSLLNCKMNSKPNILERCIFKRRDDEVYLVADAYRGDAIKQAIIDFFEAASGASSEPIAASLGSHQPTLVAGGKSNLVAYVGHDGLMDFRLPTMPNGKNGSRQAIVLACASKQFFSQPLQASGAHPLLWTTGLMAPEAYTLESALDGWIKNETEEQIRERAAIAYDKYQKCGLRGARRLLASGW